MRAFHRVPRAALPRQGEHRRQRRPRPGRCAREPPAGPACRNRPATARRCRRCPRSPPLTAPAVQAIPFQSAQAHVLIGQPGLQARRPRLLPAAGGQLHPGRQRAGLAAVARSAREARPDATAPTATSRPGLHAGAFTVGLQTRPDQAAQAIAVAKRRLARFVADGPDGRGTQGRQGQPGRRLPAAHRQQPQAAGQRRHRSPGTTCRWITWTPGPRRSPRSVRRTCGPRWRASCSPDAW